MFATVEVIMSLTLASLCILFLFFSMCVWRSHNNWRLIWICEPNSRSNKTDKLFLLPLFFFVFLIEQQNSSFNKIFKGFYPIQDMSFFFALVFIKTEKLFFLVFHQTPNRSIGRDTNLIVCWHILIWGHCPVAWCLDP